MQEPQRYNLCNILQKSMKVAQRKSFLHRVIYIASYEANAASEVQDARSFIILLDSNIKLINEDCAEDVITGFALLYTGYFINIVEGPEETILKHFSSLLETFDRDLGKTPTVTRMKILLMSFHINKRYYSAWNGRRATPPVLLDKIEPTTSREVNSRHIQLCIMKLYRMSEYLRSQPQNLLLAAMDNISELCKPHLPEVNLLDFLLDSPALMDFRVFVQVFRMVPDFTLYHEIIWPLPPNFVPFHILGEDASKKLMSLETKEPEKEAEEEEAATKKEETPAKKEEEEATT